MWRMAVGLKVSGRFKGGGAWRLVSGNRFRLRDIDVMRAGDPSQALQDPDAARIIFFLGEGDLGLRPMAGESYQTSIRDAHFRLLLGPLVLLARENKGTILMH
jgi:hypothetical protein